jgi:hypothetical protein
MTNERHSMRGIASTVLVAGGQLVWWDYGLIVCPECQRAVEGTLVRESDQDGDRAQCADCWRLWDVCRCCQSRRHSGLYCVLCMLDHVPAPGPMTRAQAVEAVREMWDENRDDGLPQPPAEQFEADVAALMEAQR